MRKRGIFITTIALLLITLFVVSFTFYSDIQQRKSIGKRVESMNNFLFSTEKDLERQVYIAGYRSIFILEDQIATSGTYISNFNSSMQELFFSGSLDNETQTIMQGAIYSDIQQLMTQRADQIGLILTISDPSYEVMQDDPWNVKLILKLKIDLKDQNNLARWYKNATIVSLLPITNFDDPIYLVNTNGVMTNKITRTPYSIFVNNGDASNLSTHIINMYYTQSTLAPSFLNRLQGSSTSSPHGIESFVNLQVLSSKGIAAQDKVNVDHIYFSSQYPSPTCTVPGTPSWAKIEPAHLSAVYNTTC